MKSLYNYIIHTDNRYNNVSESGLILNTEITERDAIFVNRVGTVASCPIMSNYGVIEKDDEVIVHHNVFRRWVGMDGKEKNSGSYIDEKTYICAPDQIFAYKRDEQWMATPGYCFVAPIENNEKWLLGGEKMLSGTLTFLSEELRLEGLSEGHRVGFTPNSEYEFTIEGKKLYRILSNQINIDYGLREREEGSNQVSSVSAETA